MKQTLKGLIAQFSSLPRRLLGGRIIKQHQLDLAIHNLHALEDHLDQLIELADHRRLEILFYQDANRDLEQELREARRTFEASETELSVTYRNLAEADRSVATLFAIYQGTAGSVRLNATQAEEVSRAVGRHTLREEKRADRGPGVELHPRRERIA